jgi:hypothetical protein
VRAAPAVSCAYMCKESAHEHTGSAEAVRHSLRNGLTAYAVLSSATNSSCHRRPRIQTSLSPVGPTRLRELSISNGCQDHTVLPYADSVARPARRTSLTSFARPATTLRADAAASTASHPAFVTIAIRPSCRERTGRAGRADLPDGESEIFFARGIDRFLSRALIFPSGRFDALHLNCGNGGHARAFH